MRSPGAGVLLLLPLSALVSFAAVARAAPPPPSVVWYRASDECPNGAAFIGRLPARAARVRLAEAGDHIDFLVTLLAGHGETVGRLERQTQSATVAIRELRDASCDHVADALALSLGLALEPTVPPAAADTPAPVVEAPATSVAETAQTAPASARAAPLVVAPIGAKRTPVPADGRDVTSPRGSVVAPSPRHSTWGVTGDGGVIAGVTPHLLAQVGVLATVDHVAPAVLPDLGFRFGVSGAIGSSSTDVGAVNRWILAGRGEACPSRWGGRSVSLTPCAALELGATGASDSRPTARHDALPWIAPGVALHGSALLFEPVTLELTGFALVPLVRSEIYAGTERLYRAEIFALQAALGVSLGFE